MNLRWRFLTLFTVLGFASSILGQDEKEKIPESLQVLADMVKSAKLFAKDQYKSVRNACCKYFEHLHEKDIKDAFGEDYPSIMGWFEKNSEIKEEFFTAIDRTRDKVPQVLKLFREVWKKSPDQIQKYPNLAIALCVVWDDPKGVYDYRQHQIRTKSKLPDSWGKMTALDVYQFYIDKQKDLLAKEKINRLQLLPWEFLVYVIDHRTPNEERDWAIKNYLAKRPLIGRIYEEVEYDTEMLRTRSRVCKLNDKPYTLESIKKHGGVCAMQADFAARVGKSLLVPSAYVGGQSQDLGLHAWVMWVEVKSASASKVQFSLESFGRYQIDNYYTGELNDPQTGLEILDRDWERRLSAVANDRVGKRQAELAMAIYPEIVDIFQLPQAKQIRYLDEVLKLSHFNESAYLELARKVKEGDVSTELKQVVLSLNNNMLRTFAKYPDFTWKVANDLIAIQNSPPARNFFYEQLVTLYEKNGRPDLACEARIKWAELLVEGKQYIAAAKGLNQTIQKFPAEGRYVPKMMEKLKEICGQFKTGNDYLSQSYQDLLKKIPPTRGDEISKYCLKMHEDALLFFKDQKGKEKIIKELEVKLQNLKAGKV
jgi:hypothetical protein